MARTVQILDTVIRYLLGHYYCGKMSSDNNNATDTSPCCCASCGIAQVDNIKLKECDNCDLVQYCSDECQAEHKSQHEQECKRRSAELRDELLFKQPERNHLGDCPICCLPLPLNLAESTMFKCCSKCICNGCCYANLLRQREMKLVSSCPFCRKPPPRNDVASNKQRMKRLEANDPMALYQEGAKQLEKGNYTSAFDYLTKAAELGVVEAQCRLGEMYLHAQGVEKDEEKAKYLLEEAAIGGHPFARYQLGCLESNNNDIGRAIDHWLISAEQGEAESIKPLMDFFKHGILEKEDLEYALRANQAAVDATKSPQRKAAEESRYVDR